MSFTSSIGPFFKISAPALTRRNRPVSPWENSYSFRNELPSKALQATDNIPIAVDFVRTSDGADLRYAWFGNVDVAEAERIDILLPGKSCVIEDLQRQANRLAREGRTVLAFDFRGQGLSARLADNHCKLHVEDFHDYTIDLQTILGVAQRHFPGCRPDLIALSMGGGVLLDSLLGNHLENVGKVTLLSPFMGAYELPVGGLIHMAAHLQAPFFGSHYFFGEDWTPEEALLELDENNIYTTLLDEAEAMIRRRQLDPRLIAHAPSAEWVRASYAMRARLRRASTEQWQRLAPHDIDLVLANDERITISQEALDRIGQIGNARCHRVKGRHALIAEQEEVLDAIVAVHTRKVDADGLPQEAEIPYKPPSEASMMMGRVGDLMAKRFYPYRFRSRRRAALTPRHADAGSSCVQ